MTTDFQIRLIGGEGYVTEDDLKRLGKQTAIILERLNRFKDGWLQGWLTAKYLETESGATRVASRITDLKYAGFLIESRRGSDKRAEYRLVGRGEPPVRKTRHCETCSCE